MALAIVPRAPEIQNNRSLALMGLERSEEALRSCDAALAIKPDYVEALNNRGIAQASLNRLDQALQSYDKAVALKPDYIEALNNKGAVLAALGRFDEALASYEAVLKFDPGSSNACYNSGWRWRTCTASRSPGLLRRRAGRQPAPSLCLERRRQCRAQSLRLGAGECPGRPPRRGHQAEQVRHFAFYLAGLQRRCFASSAVRQDLSQGQERECRDAPRGGNPYRHEKIRIAYVSSDFCDHPVAHQIVELLERHDRSRFEIYGMSLGPDDASDIRARAGSGNRSFFTMFRLMNDRDVTGLMRNWRSTSRSISMATPRTRGRHICRPARAPFR